MFFNLAPDRCAVENRLPNLPVKKRLFISYHRIGRPHLKEGVQFRLVSAQLLR